MHRRNQLNPNSSQALEEPTAPIGSTNASKGPASQYVVVPIYPLRRYRDECIIALFQLVYAKMLPGIDNVLPLLYMG